VSTELKDGSTLTCPACGATVAAGELFCESCGRDLSQPVAAPAGSGAPPAESGAAGSTGSPLTVRAVGRIRPDAGVSAAPPEACPSCGSDALTDSFCDRCGARRPAAADHSEIDFVDIAGVSDIGKRHHHNEDAMGVLVFPSTGPGVSAGVICDGVSSSNQPDLASTAAVTATIRAFGAHLAEVATALSEAVASSDRATMIVGRGAAKSPSAEAAAGTEPESAAEPAVKPAAEPAVKPAAEPAVTSAGEPAVAAERPTAELETTPEQTAAEAAMLAGAKAAQAAAALAASNDRSPNPPSSTFVAAILTPTTVTVGWVGDSRAYWLPDDETAPGQPAACLTVDDTLAGQLAAAGVMIRSEAPNAGALIRWLGADATDTTPHVTTITPGGPGRIIVCSDGLYRYVPEPEELAAATPTGTPHDVASKLVKLALDGGGHDNVSVIVMPFPPPPHPSQR
jgi:serine/threonine protein phosphatase PrpC